MTTNFDRALKFVLEHECVFKKGHWGKIEDDYVISENDPADPGGTTKWGLDARTHGGDVDALTLADATKIYRREYWEKNRCEELEWPLCAVHFDNCVNMGPGQAVKLLQRAVGVVDDGAWGPNTRAAVTAACKVRSANVVALQVVEKKRDFYESLCEIRPAMERFKQGWLNRVADLKEIC
jgi:lysozyme family protein